MSRLEKELRELRWEMEDQVNARDARVAELEGQLAHAQSGMKAAQGDYERRRAEMDRQAREKESALQACKEVCQCTLIVRLFVIPIAPIPSPTVRVSSN